MPFAQRYEHSYGISLLDDLHNLFPEILYDPARFQQNTLVQFVRERTEELFDVEFARNRAYYRLYIQPRSASIPVPSTPPPRAARTSPPPLPVRSRSFRVPLTVPIVTAEVQGTLDTTMNNTMNLLTTAFLGGLGGGLGSGIGSADLQDLLAPVPVFPTADQITQASILSSIEPPADVACAICQDHAPPSGTHEWRILRSCTHRFHKQCIDVWFRQNVHCPVCRHDIREPATT
jgi:hypothetical protein